MKFSDLSDLQAVLSAATLSDPFLALCSLAAWLDPLSPYARDEFDDFPYEQDQWNNIGLAWEIIRTCFPTRYTEATCALRTSTNPDHLTAWMSALINAGLKGGALDDLDYLHYGLPFFGRGLDLTDPHIFLHPDYERLPEAYALMGLFFNPEDTYSLPDNLEQAAYTAAVLAYSLRQDGSPACHDMACLLDWLFSQTGNTVADYTVEGFEEMGVEFLPWTPDNLAFNNDMHEEAEDILAAARRALPRLLDDPDFQARFQHNWQLIRTQPQETPHDPQRHAEYFGRRLRWDAGPHPHVADPAPYDPQNLSLRGLAEPSD